MERRERLIDLGIAAMFGVAFTLFGVAVFFQVPLLNLIASAFNLITFGLLMSIRWHQWGKRIEREQQGNS